MPHQSASPNDRVTLAEVDEVFEEAFEGGLPPAEAARLYQDLAQRAERGHDTEVDLVEIYSDLATLASKAGDTALESDALGRAGELDARDPKLWATRIRLAFAAGDEQLARDLADQARKGHCYDALRAQEIAEEFIEVGDNTTALRWLAMGLRDVDHRAGTLLHMALLNMRRRLRAEEGYGEDALDFEAQQLNARFDRVVEDMESE